MQKIDFYTAGKQAFEAGKPRVPALDVTVREGINGMPVGTGAADMMMAWTQGWDVANLAAPIDAEDDELMLEMCGE